MAEVTKSTVVRTVQEEQFTLTLSADEFRYLRNLIGAQSYGDGDGASGRIYEAMAYDLITREPDTAVKVGDRAAVLREAADALSMDWGGPDHEDGLNEARSQLRRMADEAEALKPATAVSVGDRVRILRARWAEEYHGKIGTVRSVLGSHPSDLHAYTLMTDNGRIIHATEVEPATEPGTYTIGDITYDLAAEYSDTSGDVWYFTGERDGDGVPLMSCRFVATLGDYRDGEYQNWTLTRVLAGFPLTRV